MGCKKIIIIIIIVKCGYFKVGGNVFVDWLQVICKA